MNCALWLGDKKIFSADEICDNFDIASIRGYFLGGSLIKWLASNGGEHYAEQLSELSQDDPQLNDRLTDIFTGRSRNTVPVHKADEQLIKAVESFKSGNVPSTMAGSFGGSFKDSYGSFSSLAGGSFRWNLFGGSWSSAYGSFSSTSFRTTSFGGRFWEWEWEWFLGSFRKNYGSFTAGSFNTAASSGSFNYGSFSYGSFNYGGSFRWFVSGSFDYKFGEYKGVPLNGSYRLMSSDEYDEIMYRTLNMCPLNRFGYGIHLI